MGDYNPALAYTEDQMVSHDGGLWRATGNIAAGTAPGADITAPPETVTLKTPPNAMFGGTDNAGYLAVYGQQITAFPGPTTPDWNYSGNNCWIGMQPRANDQVTLTWAGGPIRLHYNDSTGHNGNVYPAPLDGNIPTSQSPLTFTMLADTVASGKSLTAEVHPAVTSFQWGESGPSWELLVAGPPAHDPVSATTPSLAPSAGASGAVAIGENVRLVYLSTTVPARVRLYTSAAKRDADVGRGAVDPTGNHGLVLEAVTSDAQPGVALNPEPKALGLDGNLYYRITSLDDVTGPITFTVEWAIVPV